jgi:hypothetical protein
MDFNVTFVGHCASPFNLADELPATINSKNNLPYEKKHDAANSGKPDECQPRHGAGALGKI